MILTTLRMIVRPERQSDFLEAMVGMLEPSRVERGCLSYRLYKDVENRDAFILLEEWDTQEELDKHITTDNHRRVLALMDLLSENPEFQFNAVLQTRGMDYLENVLKAEHVR